MPSVQKDNTTWLKRILVPLWVVRMGLAVLNMIVWIILLATVSKLMNDGSITIGDETIDTSDLEIDQSQLKVVLGVAIVFLLLFVIVLLLDIIAIIKFMRHNLTPKALLITSAIQTAITLAVLIISIISIASAGYTDSNGRHSVGGGLWPAFSFVSYFVVLVYSSVTCHKQRKNRARGAYTPAVNPGQGQFPGGQPPQHPGVAPYQTGAYQPYGAPQYQQNTGYAGGNAMELKPTGAAAGYYGNSYNDLPEANMQPQVPRQTV